MKLKCIRNKREHADLDKLTIFKRHHIHMKKYIKPYSLLYNYNDHN